MKRLLRPRKGRKLAGVCIGISQYLDIDVTIVRIFWVFLLLPGGAPGLIPYILFWILTPEE